MQNISYTSSEDSLVALNSDIENLINESKAEWSRNPHEVSFQTKLKALFDLQTILRSQKLPPDQISLIQNQVAQLKKAPQSTPMVQATTAPLPTPVVAPPAPVQQPTLSSLLGPGALAALLARQSATPQLNAAVPATIRSPQQIHTHPYQPPLPVVPAATPVPDPASLLGRLRAAGILPGLGATTTSTPVNPTIASLPPPPFLNTPPSAARTPLAAIPNDVVLKPASLKM
jgi:pre-mRNA cleavage complex 2 protein Pcf11